MGGSTLLLLLIPPGSGPSGGSSGTGTAGAAQIVGPFGFGFFFTGAAPTPTASRAYLREAVLAALAADSTTVALVGTNVFLNVVPEEYQLPAVVLVVESIRRTETLDGPCGMVLADLAFYGVSRNATETTAIVEAVRQLFDGYTGTLTASGGSVNVYGVTAQDESDDWTAPVDSSERGIFETPARYRFQYHEPIPVR